MSLRYLLSRRLIAFDPNEQATTVGGSAAHSAWVNQSDAAAPAAPAAPAAAPPAPVDPSAGNTAATAPAPSQAGGGAAPPSPAAPASSGSAFTQGGRKAESVADATKAWLAGQPSTKPGAKPAAAPAAPAAAPTPAAAAQGAQAAGAQAAAAATAAGATPAQAQAAGAQAAEEYLDAIGADGQPFRIPAGVKIPVKINGKLEHRPIGDVQKSFMMEGAFTRRTQRLAEQERSQAAERARLQAQEKQIASDRKQYEDAQLDPEKWEQYQEHLKMLQSNAMYREKWERGRQAEIDSAELEAFRGTESESVAASVVEQIQATMQSMATEYPGVDPELVRQAYAGALTNGQADLTEASLRSFFVQEADRAQRYAGPLQTQVESMRRELDALKATRAESDAAQAHNARTDSALERDRLGRFTSPAGGGAPDITRNPPPSPYTSDQREARNRAWIDQGRRGS